MIKYSLFLIILLSSCKVKKEVTKTEIKEETKIQETTNWIRTENIFSKVDGSAQIEFDGLSEVVIDYRGNISMKGNNAKINTESSRVDSIFKTDTLYIDRTIETVKEVKIKELKKEKAIIPTWVIIALILVVIGFGIYRVIKSKLL